MAKNNKKADKKNKGKKTKKKKNKQDTAEIVSVAVGNLARKSTKKLIKSFEKRTGNLASKITPANLIAAALDTTGKTVANEVKQDAATLTETK